MNKISLEKCKEVSFSTFLTILFYYTYISAYKSLTGTSFGNGVDMFEMNLVMEEKTETTPVKGVIEKVRGKREGLAEVEAKKLQMLNVINTTPVRATNKYYQMLVTSDNCNIMLQVICNKMLQINYLGK
jgi:hypothetical protein